MENKQLEAGYQRLTQKYPRFLNTTAGTPRERCEPHHFIISGSMKPTGDRAAPGSRGIGNAIGNFIFYRLLAQQEMQDKVKRRCRPRDSAYFNEGWCFNILTIT